MLLVDDGPGRDPGRDGDRGDAYAETVEAEAELARGVAGGGCGSGAGRYVVVGAAVLVEGDEQGRVQVVRAVRGRRGAQSVVDPGEQFLAAEDAGGGSHTSPGAADQNGGCMSLWSQPMICGSMKE